MLTADVRGKATLLGEGPRAVSALVGLSARKNADVGKLTAFLEGTRLANLDVDEGFKLDIRRAGVYVVLSVLLLHDKKVKSKMFAL